MSKLQNFFSKISKYLLPAAGLVLIFVMLSEPALAKVDELPKTLSESMGGFMQIFSFAIILITLLSYVFAFMVGDLIDSTYILDSGMGDTLHLIWSVTRNFVNIGFILVLLIIAAMVVFGGGGEKGLGMLKKVLPKFILALIFVNFTFFAGRFILTTNDVLATAIFALPKTVSGENMLYLPCDVGSTPEECRATIGTTVTSAFSKDLKAGEDTKDKAIRQIEELQNNLQQHKVADMIDKKNVSLILLTSMLDLANLTSTKGVIGGGWDMIISGFAALIAAGAMGIIIFMLLLALIVRMVVLWMCLAFSPIAALGIVLGDVIPGANMKGDLDLLSIFIKHAFMPTMVAIPLSIGLIMIFANNAIGYDYALNDLFSFGDGAHAGNFHSLLWWIASIAILWIGTNKAIQKSSEFASKVTDGIHNGVNKFAGGVAGTLKYAPIMPAFNGGKERVSLGALAQVPSRMQGKLAAQASGAADELSRKPAEMFGWRGNNRKDESFIGEFHQAKDLKGINALLEKHHRQGGTDVALGDKERSRLSDLGIPLAASVNTFAKAIKDEKFIEVMAKLPGLENARANYVDVIAPAMEEREAKAVEDGKESAITTENKISKDAIVAAGGDASVAGKALDKKEGEPEPKKTEMKMTINDEEKKVYESEDGIYYVMNTEDKTENGYSAVGKKETIAKTMAKMDEGDAEDGKYGILLAEKLEELSKSKSLITDEQMGEVYSKVDNAIKKSGVLGKRKIKDAHANDLLIPFRKMFEGKDKYKDVIEELQKIASEANK